MDQNLLGFFVHLTQPRFTHGLCSWSMVIVDETPTNWELGRHQRLPVLTELSDVIHGNRIDGFYKKEFILPLTLQGISIRLEDLDVPPCTKAYMLISASRSFLMPFVDLKEMEEQVD